MKETELAAAIIGFFSVPREDRAASARRFGGSKKK